jgi:hypothetical protein
MQARTHGKVIISGRTIQTTIGAIVSHAVFLSGGLGDRSNCEAGTISFPNGQILGGQAAQGLYEIALHWDAVHPLYTVISPFVFFVSLLLTV